MCNVITLMFIIPIQNGCIEKKDQQIVICEPRLCQTALAEYLSKQDGQMRKIILIDDSRNETHITILGQGLIKVNHFAAPIPGFCE